MEEKLKQRMVGAVVLVALVVIFLPMLLDRPQDELGGQGSNLPQPAPTIERPELAPIELPGIPPVLTQVNPGQDTAPKPATEAPEPADSESDDDAVEEVDVADPEPAPAEEPGDAGSAATTATAAGASDAAESAAAPAAPTPQPVVEAPVAAPAKPPASAQTSTEPAIETPPALSGWVVQLGSFRSRENAFALRDRLRAMKYSCFVEEAKTASGTSYRVRVGPELERGGAEKLRDRLLADVEMEGLVTSYP